MHVKVILNPYANRWRAQKRLPDMADTLAAAGLLQAEYLDVAVRAEAEEAAEDTLFFGEDGE